MREALAEFFGTAILMTFGLGVVAQTVLSNNDAGSPLGIHLCWGLAVILGVYTSAG
jgi:aquaglyceroporin related protein, other eukaryote